MQTYKYTDEYERVYPDILDPPNGSLVAHPGDVRQFDSPPDHRWVPVVPDYPVVKPASPVAEEGQE